MEGEGEAGEGASANGAGVGGGFQVLVFHISGVTTSIFRDVAYIGEL
jgi:hypothetical protein